MNSLFAIIKQTIRSSTRSKVFHILFVIILLAVFLLPTTVSGDGTASGLVQITLTYSLNVAVALISATALWLACSMLPREIENYTVHMVVAKPCPRWKLWLGKWLGIFLMNGFILLASAAVIYGLVLWRVSHGNFAEGELEKLKREVLVGRRAFRPEYPNFQAMAEKEYEKQKANLPEGHNARDMKYTIFYQLIQKYNEIQPDTPREYTFKNIRLTDDDNDIVLRFRLFSGEAKSTNQQMIPCIWGTRIPEAAEQVADPFIYATSSFAGGTFQEISISQFLTGQFGQQQVKKTVVKDGVEKETTVLQDIPAKVAVDTKKDDSVTLRFSTLPKEYWAKNEAMPVIMQLDDGPILLTKAASFTDNYCRTILLALLQIAFIVALGCTVGAAFSTPVAAFTAIAYLVIGLSVQLALSAPITDGMGGYKYKGTTEMLAHKFAQGVSMVVVSVDDLDSTADLAQGRLVEYSRIRKTFLTMIILRCGLLAALGITVLTKRELGLVARKM